MEINVYQPCPCHPEKKIKFCCGKDIVNELDEVLSKHRARQTRAALAAIDRLIARSGPRDCLLSTKVSLLMALDEYDQALEANDAFLRANPGHFLGLEQRALLLAMLNRPLDAVSALQDAMDHLPTAEVPLTFAIVFLRVAEALFDAGYYLAARKHANFAGELKGNTEISQRAAEIGLAAAKMIPFAVDTEEPTVPPASDAPWFKKADNARRAMQRGQFRKAARLAQRGLELAPDQPVLLSLRAFALGALGDAGQVEAFRALSQSAAFSEPERCEFEAIAQVAIEAQAEPERLVYESYELNDVPRVCEALRSHPQLVEFTPDRGGDHRPQYSFVALDRPLPDSSQPVTLDNVPCVVGQVSIFGRRTDREASLGVSTVPDSWLRRCADEWTAANGQPLKLLGSDEIIGSTSLMRAQESPHFYWLNLSKNLTLDLLHQHFRRFLLTDWPDMPLPELDGLTPRQASSDETMRLRLLAWLWRFKLRRQAIGQSFIEELTAEALRQLGIAPLASVPFAALQRQPFSVMAAFYTDLRSIPTLELLTLWRNSLLINPNALPGHLYDELLTRGDLPENFSRTDVLVCKATSVEDAEVAHRLFQEAVEVSRANGSDPVYYQLAWLNWTLEHGKYASTLSLLKDLLNHPQSHQFKIDLDTIFLKYGLLSEDGEYMIPQQDSEAETIGSSASRLWTPDQDEPPSAVSSVGTSKLWLPGS